MRSAQILSAFAALPTGTSSPPAPQTKCRPRGVRRLTHERKSETVRAKCPGCDRWIDLRQDSGCNNCGTAPQQHDGARSCDLKERTSPPASRYPRNGLWPSRSLLTHYPGFTNLLRVRNHFGRIRSPKAFTSSRGSQPSDAFERPTQPASKEFCEIAAVFIRFTPSECGSRILLE